MVTRTPNLELLLYKTQQLLANDEEFKQAIANIKAEKNMNRVYLDFNVECFPQIWGNTCTGFDVTPEGEPTMGGDAMTKEYTTIIHEVVTDTYCVFFGDCPCYKVSDPSEDFYKDMIKRSMASLSEAKNRY
mgnify:CR=1 FL=1